MRKIIIALALASAATAAFAHDFTQENAKFQSVAVTKDMNSPTGVEARVALERANAEIEQGDVRMLLKIRSMTNDAFKAIGGQPAFLGSEIKRLEEAIASPKDSSGVAKAKEMLVRIKAEKAAYDVIDKSAGENMKKALELIEKVPPKL
jgi:glycine cleavage system pyridoxal-binding protein P